MDELTTRLEAIEARLEAVEQLGADTSYRIGHLHETLEERIEKRRREINDVWAELRRLENNLRYDIDRATQAAERATRRW